MHSGEADPYRLSRTQAANDNSRPARATWRRLVAALVMGAFTLMLISLGFTRYAHHPAYGSRHSAPLLNPN
jgi:fatty-acid desaturase